MRIDRVPIRLARPVALVTGCSSGIGLCAVPTLVRRGFHVVATMRDLSRRAALDEVVDEHVTVLPLDVLRQNTIDDCVGTVLDTFGRIDVLVNNAGIAGPNFVEEAPLAQWREVFETNVFGQAAVTNAVLPSMRARNKGRVVMVSSLGGRVPTPMLGVYCSSKFALEGYAETLRLELRRTGVNVSLIEPGAFRTDMWNSPVLYQPVPTDSPYAADFARLQAFYRDCAVKDLGDPVRVAEVIADVAAGRKRRLRYPVGTDAWMEIALRAVLPWAVYERVARKLVSLKP
jgi:NAD(P)-dependent dehydrogenase (short-subunit alcohol dehydrogenase family)